MPILFQNTDRSFFLQTPHSTYAFAIHPRLNIPVHRHWGCKIGPADLGFLPMSESVDTLPQELPTYGHGDYRAAALTVGQQDGSRILELCHREHRIAAGKVPIPGLPATYVEADEEADTLEIDLADEQTGITVTLSYTVFRDFDAIARSMRIRNGGGRPVQLLNVASASVDLPNRAFDLIHLTGSWVRERHVQRQRVVPGRFAAESRRGASSHPQHPFLALLDPHADETSGEVFGFSLVYSGSFSAAVETDTYFCPRVTLGLHPDEFSWQLDPGETFHSPEAVLVHSAEGLGEMSRTFHALYRTRLARGNFRDEPRPSYVNNWDATYFDFDEKKLLNLAKLGAEAGIEMFVLDDGWFGKRDGDNCSLGDWVVDRRKLPDGLEGLARKINGMGMKFGLWFEPEMISPDSDLYRAHPDWCLHVPGRERKLSRHQLVLDFSRPEICDYIIESVAAVLRSAPIEYVKWDMNRNMTEVGSAALPAHRQRETAHRYILGLYHVLETLITDFPHILFEGCASGGGRFDPGLLHYMPQSWTSDNSDAVSRLKIQFGTSLVYPLSAMAAYISESPNQQHGRITPLDTRFNVALTGAFGYGEDLETIPPDELAAIKGQVAFYKEHRELLAKGALHRLRDTFQSNEAAWSIVAPDRSEALAFHVNILVEANVLGTLLRLRGLDAAASYQVSGIEKPMKGDVLINVGLPVPPAKGDFCSHRWHLKRV